MQNVLTTGRPPQINCSISGLCLWICQRRSIICQMASYCQTARFWFRPTCPHLLIFNYYLRSRSVFGVGKQPDDEMPWHFFQTNEYIQLYYSLVPTLAWLRQFNCYSRNICHYRAPKWIFRQAQLLWWISILISKQTFNIHDTYHSLGEHGKSFW